MQVTSRNISTLPPGMHRLERCLYLRKREDRSPVWVFRYMIAGKRKDMVIGSVQCISISQAKETGLRLRSMVADGIDPLTVKQEKKEKIKEASESAKEERPYTFAELVDEALPVIIQSRAWRNRKHSEQWGSTIQTYAVPIIGDKVVEEIERTDILSVLTPIWREKSETAQRLRGRLEAIFSYAIATGKRTGGNPATWRGNLELFLPQTSKVHQVEHHEALTVIETKALFADWMPPRSVTACAIIFGALTASRVGEFVPAKWEEVDFKNRLWMCPPERRKDGKPYPHRVPLSDQAMHILTLLPKDSEYIFANNRGKHISKETPRAIIQKKLGHGTMHGFRSTFRDWCAETGKDPTAAEKSLMHATGSAVVQAYQRSDLLEARRVLMQEWADTIYPMNEQ